MGYRSWAWCYGAGSSQPCHSLPGAAAECAIGHKLQETPASHSELLKVGGSSLSWKQGLGTGTFTCWLHKAAVLSCALSTGQGSAQLQLPVLLRKKRRLLLLNGFDTHMAGGLSALSLHPTLG